MNVGILYDGVIEKYAQEDIDEAIEMKLISDALTDLGFTPLKIPLSLNIDPSIFQKYCNSFVFNCLDSLEEKGSLAYIIPTILDELDIPYTGSSAEAIYLTSNKIITKRILKSAGLLTPPWMTVEDVIKEQIAFEPPYIIKPIREDGSSGLDENSVIYSKKLLREAIMKRSKKDRDSCFIASYIEGREFNVSLLIDKYNPQILPPLEIQFKNFPEDKPKFIDYKAKWIKTSFEYQNTVRNFEFSSEDIELLDNLVNISEKCWSIFGLEGYARIDFRVDSNGIPWILEINANPYLRSDSSFISSANKAGLDFNQVIERIIQKPVKKIKSQLNCYIPGLTLMIIHFLVDFYHFYT